MLAACWQEEVRGGLGEPLCGQLLGPDTHSLVLSRLSFVHLLRPSTVHAHSSSALVRLSQLAEVSLISPIILARASPLHTSSHSSTP